MIAKGKNGDQRRKQKRKAFSWLMVLCMVLTMFSSQFAAAEVGDVPAHEKSITDNHDGTYKLELSVTGDADTEVETAANVNVLIVYDVSNSMTSNAGNTRYSRADQAEDVVHDFIANLRGYQSSSDPSNIQMALVTFARTGSIRQTQNQNWTSNLTDANGINRFFDDGGTDGNANLTYTGNASYGTNWESALTQAQTLLNNPPDNDPTFVIFVTDGAPTASGNGNNAVSPSSGLNTLREYYEAGLAPARAIQNRANTTLFGIYAYGTEADLLDDLMYYANTGRERTIGAGTNPTDNYFNASDTAALNTAIESIFQTIVEALGVSKVQVNDGTTNKVETTSGEVSELLEVIEDYQYWLTIPLDANNRFQRIDLVSGESVTYTVSGNGSTVSWGSNSVTVNGEIFSEGGQRYLKYEWKGANALYNVAPPAAELNEETGAVDWNLNSAGTLLDGVKYSVTFDVYPSQETYDIIAGLKNDDIQYSELEAEGLDQYIVDNGGGSYSLRTNTKAGIQWDDTRDDAGMQRSDYKNPDPVATSADQLTIKKEWEGGTPPNVELPITILMDDEEFHTAKLSAATDWETKAYISVGIIKNGQVLPGAEGHDFSFAELDDTQYRWELDAPTVRPMLINGGGDDHTPTMLVKVDAKHHAPSGAQTYTIDGATYYVDEGASGLTATNYRRSNLNLTKVVTGEDAPEDATFPFTLTVTNAKAPANEPQDDPEHNSDYWVWFSIQDEKGATVTDATVSGATVAGGGYYYTKSGSSISVSMKDGWNLRFTNLPSGSTYTFVEGDLADGFAFKSAELTAGEDSTFSGGQTTTGKIENVSTSYYVTYTNDYQLTDLEITKVWEDNDNQDGIRLSEDGLKAKLTLSPAVAGKEPTVTDKGNGTYTITYTGLPRYSDGEEIEYTVAESAIDGYTTTGSPAKDHGTITNTHEPEVIDIPVEKIWEDNNNQDGIRPGSVTVQLKVGDAVIDSTTLSKDNNWEDTFTDLPKYSGGEEIEYEIEEEQTSVITGEDAEGTYGITYGGDAEEGFTVTNIHTPIVTKHQVVKIWNDDENKDGHRPDTLEVYLKADGKAALDKDGNPITAELEGPDWSHEWTNLPKYNGTSVIKYSADEVSVPATYEKTSVEDIVDTDKKVTGTAITNSRESDKTTYKVVKIWDDASNQDGIRPSEIWVQLFRDDKELGDPVKLEGEGDSWSYTWTGLEKNKPATENKDDNATPAEPGRSTKAAPAETKVVETVAPDETESAPAEDESVETQDVEADETETVETEENEPADEATVDAVETDAAESDATEEDAVVEEEADEEDADEEDADEEDAVAEENAVDETDEAAPEQGDSEKREAPTRALAANVTPYIYTADEVGELPAGYEKTKVENIVDTEGNITGIAITNSHVPDKTQVTVKKIWDDANDQDGIRKDVGATVQLFKTVNGNTTPVTDPVDVAITDDWTYSWGDLPVKENGKLIHYSVVETLPEGSKYSKSGDGVDMEAKVGNTGTVTITNSYTPEKTKVTVKKIWEDKGDQDGKRASVNATVQLYKKVGTTTTAVGDPESVGTAANWSKTWENLAVRNKGDVITYFVTETLPNGSEYTKSGDGEAYGVEAKKDDSGTITITNTYDPKTTDLKITKNWDDENDQDGYRPTADQFKAKLHLWMTTEADGRVDVTKQQEYGGKLIVTPDPEDATKYIVSVAGLPMFKPGSIGSSITWTISEDQIDEYDAIGDIEVGNGGEFTNKHVPETMTLTVDKLWDDANDQDGKRANVNATVQLYKKVGNGEAEAVGQAVPVGTADDWSKTWEGLAVRDKGKVITYFVTETLPNGSEYTKSGDDVTVTASKDGDETIEITNKYTPKKINISVKKQWDDADNRDGKRADVGATVQLYKQVGQGQKTAVGAPVTVGTADDWSNLWRDQPVYEKGQKITYSVVETLPDGSEYTSEDVDAQTAEENTPLTFNIKNSYEPKTINITVNKEWDDADDQDGKRADVGATVQLYKQVGEGQKTAVGAPVTVGDADDWSNLWKDLYVYENGQKITYSVVETLPDGTEYTTEAVDAKTAAENTNLTFDITNSYTPETVDVKGIKKWEGEQDEAEEALRPESITVNLIADGEAAVDEEGNPITATVTADDDWAFEFKDLPKYKNHGTKIVYTVTEDPVDGYRVSITNPKDVTEDPDDPESRVVCYEVEITNTIDVRPRADGAVLNIKKVNEDNIGLEGVEFTLKPEEGSEAEPKVVTTDENGEATIEIKVEDGWLVNDERKHPEDYKFELSEDVPTGYKEAGPWTVTVKPEGDAEYEIAVDETTEETYFDRFIQWVVKEAGATYEYEGKLLTIKNEKEKVEVPVEKIWEEEDPKFDIRPESITVDLMAKVEGEETKKVDSAELSEENKWNYTFEDLDKYAFDDKGKAKGLIDYSVDEVEVAGYESAITGDMAEGYTITNTMKFGDVRITKDLLTYEDSGEATFVYSVKATMEVAGKDKPVVVYDGVVTLDFEAATSADAVIKHLPAGAKVDVEELYSGAAYEQKSGPAWDTEDQTIVADEEIGVEFSNAYNGELTQGYGILNEYEAKDGKWVHVKEIINSNVAGEEQ